jgi:hypothetical protein
VGRRAPRATRRAARRGNGGASLAANLGALRYDLVRPDDIPDSTDG